MTGRTVRSFTVPVGTSRPGGSPQPASLNRNGALWRLERVRQEVGLSRSTIRRLELSGEFPRRVRLSGNSVAWWSGQIEAWKADRCVVDTG